MNIGFSEGCNQFYFAKASEIANDNIETAYIIVENKTKVRQFAFDTTYQAGGESSDTLSGLIGVDAGQAKQFQCTFSNPNTKIKFMSVDSMRKVSSNMNCVDKDTGEPKAIAHQKAFSIYVLNESNVATSLKTTTFNSVFRYYLKSYSSDGTQLTLTPEAADPQGNSYDFIHNASDVGTFKVEVWQPAKYEDPTCIDLGSCLGSKVRELGWLYVIDSACGLETHPLTLQMSDEIVSEAKGRTKVNTIADLIEVKPSPSPSPSAPPN